MGERVPGRLFRGRWSAFQPKARRRCGAGIVSSQGSTTTLDRQRTTGSVTDMDGQFRRAPKGRRRLIRHRALVALGRGGSARIDPRAVVAVGAIAFALALGATVMSHAGESDAPAVAREAPSAVFAEPEAALASLGQPAPVPELRSLPARAAVTPVRARAQPPVDSSPAAEATPVGEATPEPTPAAPEPTIVPTPVPVAPAPAAPAPQPVRAAPTPSPESFDLTGSSDSGQFDSSGTP